MTVIREQGCLRVLLSETETAHYNIDRLLFCRCGFTAEAVLLKLYKKAAEQTGFFTAAQRLSIEIYPIQSGGCEVFRLDEFPYTGTKYYFTKDLV